MKTTLLFLQLCSFVFLTQLAIAQIDPSVNCSKRDHFSTNQLKINSLSIAQIAESEKYDVYYYAIDIAMDNLTTNITGTGEIQGTARVVLDSVLFELFSTYSISDIRLNGTTVPYSRNSSAIKVPVNLTAGQNFKIEIDYNGTAPSAATNPLGGSGISNGTSGSWGNQVTWSLSEPFSAYEWWPCKQSLNDKADSCYVKVTVPSTCKAGSNGMLENVVDLGNGTTRYEWKHRHAIDYYLISVAVAEYVEYNVYANPVGAPAPVLVQNFVYNNPQTLITFQNDIDETVDFIELFANLYGPYPFDDEKYGHCMAPLSGGMEHQTMTTQGWFEKELTSHELGHQWWGDNITCASWADIWINEGFATYSAYLMLENLYPNESTADMNSKHSNIKSSPGGSVWCLDSLNEGSIFSGRLSYDKGAAIIHTFRFMMNDDVTFFNTLKAIQTDFSDSTIHGIEVRDYLSTASSVDYTNAFNEWYFGEGFPTYSAKWNVVGNDFLLEINQTTSSTTPLFTNDLELRLARQGMNDTIVRVPINSNSQQYILQDLANVIQLNQIDPNNWIVNNQGSVIHDVNFTGLGLEELAENITVSISPNPSNGVFEIQANFEGENNVIIYDLNGRIITDFSFLNSSTFNLSEEENGYYIVHIKNQQGDKVIKTIIKQ